MARKRKELPIDAQMFLGTTPSTLTQQEYRDAVANAYSEAFDLATRGAVMEELARRFGAGRPR